MSLLLAIAFALVLSALLVVGTIRVARALSIGIDRAEGVQKMHSHWVPRLGGIPVFLALSGATLTLAWHADRYLEETAFLLLCCLPAFGIGLLEDFTEAVGARIRLAFTMISAALGFWLLDGQLAYLDFGPLDPLLTTQVGAAFAMTLFAAAGVANAINIIDGCNGLSSFVAMVVLAAIGIVAWQVGDTFVASSALIAVGALLGFFLWNFPFGRIFMGDAGAYLTGFLIAELAILLVRANPEVSPWFPMLLMAYPVTETLYSIYRRSFVTKASLNQPDTLHLHQLIYYRLVRVYPHSSTHSQQAARSSVAAAYLWILTLLCAVPALFFWDNGPVLKACCVLFMGLYMLLHTALVRFRAPRLLIIRWPVAAKVRSRGE